MSNLAQFYERGLGAPRDVTAALALYRRAADGGVAEALAGCVAELRTLLPLAVLEGMHAAR